MMQRSRNHRQVGLLVEARRHSGVEPMASGFSPGHVVDGTSSSPFYRMVPKELSANLRFRRAMIELGCESRENARELWIMCARDLLFFTNTFVWTHDPSPTRNLTGDDRPLVDYPVVPMLTWDYQDGALLEIDGAISRYDLVIKKSRDMGATWMALIAIIRRFCFYDMQSFMCLSRTEDAVDKRNDTDSLFWKIDFILDGDHRVGGLPGWLKPPIDRKFLHFGNTANGACIDGGSTAADAGRGGRRTAILHDEFASVPDGYAMLAATRDATPCRLINSTPKGTGNAFYDVAHNGGIRCLTLHWSQHPLKSRAMWLDGSGKQRSPWYELQCRRAAHPMEIAQELDIDFLGSSFQFFDSSAIQQAQARDVRDPYWQGDIEYDPLTGNPTGLTPRQGGPLRLWMALDQDGKAAAYRKFAMGADISTGSSASNSVLSIGDMNTMEKVGEFAITTMNPQAFAVLVYALGHWFKNDDSDAYLIWENNGPGNQFRDQILRMGYRNYWFRRDDNKFSGKVTDYPGWHSTETLKERLLGEYRRAIASGDFINRSYRALEECKQYIYTKEGKITHSRSASTQDPTGAKENHGDRVIADALLWRIMRDRRRPAGKPQEENPGTSFWKRRQRYVERKRSSREEILW